MEDRILDLEYRIDKLEEANKALQDKVNALLTAILGKSTQDLYLAEVYNQDINRIVENGK